MNHPTHNQPLLAASRLTGADLQLERLQQAIASKLSGQATITDAGACERLEAVRQRFRELYALSFEKHLGHACVEEVLAGLQSASAQRYLAARSAMEPTLQQRLRELQQSSAATRAARPSTRAGAAGAA